MSVMPDPPEFDPDTAPDWEPMYDPYFSSPAEAEKWAGTSEFADGGDDSGD